MSEGADALSSRSQIAACAENCKIPASEESKGQQVDDDSGLDSPESEDNNLPFPMKERIPNPPSPPRGKLPVGAEYKLSGHETFVCRYAWLPKAVQAVLENSEILTPRLEEDAMVELGVGKNMVRSIRFWAEAADVIRSSVRGHTVTDFGKAILGTPSTRGLDPYLEDIQTLWLIHWKFSTNLKALILSWDVLMNHFQEPYLHASSAVAAFQRALPADSQKIVSAGALEQLYEVFIRSYVPKRSRQGEIQEENLDCPLVELGILQQNGFAQTAEPSDRPEPKYVFRRQEKIEIGNSLFAYCLDEFWRNRICSSVSRELTIPLHAVANAPGSPGQVFKIPEIHIRKRLLGIENITDGVFKFMESAAIPMIVRRNETDEIPLETVYEVAAQNV